MPYDIETQDGIIIEDIPDNVPPDDPSLIARVQEARAQMEIPSERTVMQPLEQPSQELTVDSALRGAANIGVTGVSELAKMAGQGALATSGLIAGQDVPTAIGASESLIEKVPSIPLGENADLLINHLSEKYNEFAPETIKNLISDYSQLGKSLGEADFARTEGDPLMSPEARAASATANQILPDIIEMITGGTLLRKSADKIDEAIDLSVDQARDQMPDFIEMANEGGQANIGRGASQFPKTINKAVALNQRRDPEMMEIKRQLEEKKVSKDAARYMLTDEGRVQKDPLVDESIDKGFEKGLAAVIKSASEADKAKGRRMVDMRERGVQYPLEEGINRPNKVAGESLIQRLNIIKTENRKAGRDLGKEAENLKGQYVDLTSPITNFGNSLKELGVGRNADGSFNYDNSIIKDNPAATKVLNAIMSWVNRGDASVDDAHRAHMLKKLIDDQVTYGKAGEGFAGRVHDIVKEFRTDIDGVLDGNFPAYDNANIRYADTIGALNEIQDLSGKNIDLDGARGADAGGKMMRKIFSNYTTADRMLEGLSLVESVAKKYGGKFDDNMIFQSFLASELDRLFGASGSGTFQGIQESAFTTAGNAIKDPKGTVVRGVGKAASKIINKEIDLEKEKFRILRELLRANRMHHSGMPKASDLPTIIE